MNRKLLLIGFSLWLAGCASISTRTHVYTGAPKYPPADPLKVQILRVAPTRPHDRLGEIALDATDDPSRERVEKKLKKAAAKLGADALVVVFDQRRLFPVVYVDWWGATFSAQEHHGIIAIAIKYKP